jgi:hypothetical protein
MEFPAFIKGNFTWTCHYQEVHSLYCRGLEKAHWYKLGRGTRSGEDYSTYLGKHQELIWLVISKASSQVSDR